MKKAGAYIFLMVICVANLTAQPRKNIHKKDGKRNRIQLQKVEFLSEKLKLSSKKTLKFKKLYNERFQRLIELHKRERQLRKKLRTLQEIKDYELEQINDSLVNIATKKSILKKEYYQKFKQILSAREILLLHQGEREFRKKLIKRMRVHPSQKPTPK